jgi:assimilatory nitrate reductase catalytic subunit
MMGEPRTVKSTCPYCGVGCGVVIEAEGDRIVGVRGDPDHPANFGKLCSKGSTLHLTVRAGTEAQGRATRPLRRAGRGGSLIPVAWEAALDEIADRLATTVERHGPDSIGLYVSGQLLTEDYYVFNKLAKGLVGTNNIDTNSRLCMSSAVSGYKQSLGADAPPCSYADIDHADCLFIAGSNTAWAHPVLFRRIETARARNPSLRLIVVDPRKTETAREADLHLAILPGTDVALCHAMLHVMLWEDLADLGYIERCTEGFDDLKRLVREFTPRAAAGICGIAEDDIVQAARWFAGSQATLSLYCQGLNQSASGTAKNSSLINLHLATGHIGKPGAGPFSLTGQPNAMGGREVGGMANLLPAHRELSNPAHRAEIARFWGIERLAERPGTTAVEMFEAAREGKIKALWIVCTNPAQSMPDQAAIREALAKAELVILQEAFLNTETAAGADFLLPATSWGEKDGTVTNSERRISRVRRALRGPAEARDDWRIAVDVARRLEARWRPGAPTLFPYASVEDIFAEHRETTRFRDLDITGMSYALLDGQGPQQWPLPEGSTGGLERLYCEGTFPTASGRARFVATPFAATVEKTDARFPIALNTGRLRDQWHGMSRTGTVAQLFNHSEEPRLAMHATDLARRGLEPGDLVQVQSRRAAVRVMVEVSEDLRPGQAFLPMHWGSASLSGIAALGVNALTTSARDPVSQQPELKHAAIRVTKAELPWRLVAFGRPLEGDALALRERLRGGLHRFAFASCVLIGRDDPGVLLRAAGESPFGPECLREIDALFGLEADSVLRYDDPRRSIGRRIRVIDGTLAAVRLSGDLRAEQWLRQLWNDGASVEGQGAMLLACSPSGPSSVVQRGRILCTCWDVTDRQVMHAAQGAAGGSETVLRCVQEKLRCGTQCGSCLPEVKRVLASLETVAVRQVELAR